MNEMTSSAGRQPSQVRKRPLLPPKFVQAMLAGHSALGLAFAALIYIVCLTGTLSVFLHDFHRWEQPDAPLASGPIKTEAIAEATRAGHAQAVADNVAQDLFLFLPSALSPRFLVTYFNDAGKEGEWVADNDGRLVTRVVSPWSEFLAHLHMELHLPRTWGLFIVGLTGVALLSSLISGLLAHPRIFKDAFALRWGRSKRLQQADLHNRLGVWALPFHVVVSLTGALLGLATLIIGVLALAAYNGDSEKAFATILGPRAAVTEEPAPVPDVAPMVASVQSKAPNAELVAVHYQRIATSGQHVNLTMRTPGHLAFGNTYYFDGNGKPLGDGGLEVGGIGQQILGVLQPLHFGWFGGLGTKVIYALLGLAMTIVTQTGVAIWLSRRRDKGLPAEKWERLWSAVTWGQPLALAACAFASLFIGEELLVVVYLAVTLATLVLAAGVREAATVRRAFQGLSAVALAAVAVLHFNRWHGLASDPASAWIDGSLLLAALLFALLAFQPNGEATRNQAAKAAL
ncbi:PepSY-associated TM helix domain-containing protein [Hyphomicrobium sp.]|uniref:PepSY-associated TM helix domain-containing protein n=1 Tax=Hyphomicrobium sp. TaxID=82 RepID=UPI002D77854E|nr:PepSY-associated TM helix domain-containing protein [Hyphomicrobium sp.]HET6389517.1 PepSY-associated TM helix domain-containing protein [Hyphomicrobium sp.]